MQYRVVFDQVFEGSDQEEARRALAQYLISAVRWEELNSFKFHEVEEQDRAQLV